MTVFVGSIAPKLEKDPTGDLVSLGRMQESAFIEFLLLLNHSIEIASRC
jgi:hypothetical protein